MVNVKLLDKNIKLEILSGGISPYENYCDGYGNSLSTGNAYLLGLVLSVGKSVKKFSHSGSKMLDEINVFDIAETTETYIGQINMSLVSSFCGLNGLIWGYDICRTKSNLVYQKELFRANLDGISAPVYSVSPVLKATKNLFGTLEKKKFPLLPGSHVPCAGKNIKMEGPGIIYASIAIGIPEIRNEDACLLMEDVGIIPDVIVANISRYRDYINKNISNSVLQIGINQRVKYKKILVGAKLIIVKEGEIACALVAAPYFTIAKNAIINGSLNKMLEVDLETWSKKTSRIS